MEILTKKTIFLIQIVVLVFIVILIKKRFIDKCYLKEGFSSDTLPYHYYQDRDPNNENDTRFGCYLINNASEGCPNHKGGYFHKKRGIWHKDAWGLRNRETNVNPVECAKRKPNTQSWCNSKKIKTFFRYNKNSDKDKKDNPRITGDELEPTLNEYANEGVGHIVFFTMENYEGEPFNIPLPPSKQRYYFSKSDRIFKKYNDPEEDDKDKGYVDIKSLIIPGKNDDIYQDSYRNIKLKLFNFDLDELFDSSSDTNKHISQKDIKFKIPPNKNTKVSIVEISPLVEFYDLDTPAKILEHNKLKYEKLDTNLQKQLNENIQSRNIKHQEQNIFIDKMSDKIIDDIDVTVAKLRGRLLSGKL